MSGVKLQFPLNLILESEADSALCEIVRGQLNFDSISRYQTDVMLAHLAADVGDNTMTILQFNLKLSIRQCFDYLSC